MIVVVGITTVLTMPRAEDPEMNAPQFPLIVVYPGTSPEDLEEMVVKPIEKKLFELEDIKRIKYIKKLVKRYVENGDLKERLILNHLTILYNVFGAEHLCRILYLKMKIQYSFIKPFLIMLNIIMVIYIIMNI
jgi:hypothetical protein